MITSEFAWMNGKLLPFAQATTHVSAFTLHHGVAVGDCGAWIFGGDARLRNNWPIQLVQLCWRQFAMPRERRLQSLIQP